MIYKESITLEELLDKLEPTKKKRSTKYAHVFPYKKTSSTSLTQEDEQHLASLIVSLAGRTKHR